MLYQLRRSAESIILAFHSPWYGTFHTGSLPTIVKNLLLYILTFVCFVSTLSLNAQIRRTDLEGDWQTNNKDKIYYKTDSIEFHLDINHWLNIETCDIVNWRTEKRSFNLIETYLCTEPGRQSWSTEKEKLLIKTRDFGQVIQLKRSGELFDQFKVIELAESRVDRYPFDIKQLTVLRFDKLEDLKLYNYIDSLVYQVLKYRPEEFDSAAINLITEGAAATTAKITIRDSRDSNPRPLLVVNGHVAEHYEILKLFLFVEVTAIKYLTREQATILYGTRAVNGVIVIQLSNRKFKRIWKEYGG